MKQPEMGGPRGENLATQIANLAIAVFRRSAPFIAVYRRLSPFGIAVFRRVGSPIGADRRRFSPSGISDLPGVPRLPGLFAAWDLRSIK